MSSIFSVFDTNTKQMIPVDQVPLQMQTSPAGGSSLTGKTKSVTTANVRVQLDAIACREVTVIARKSNTGSIYVGGSDVSNATFGVELSANEAFTFNVSNANLIYITSSVSGEGVSYVAI